MKKFLFILLFPFVALSQSIYEDIPRLFEQKQYEKAEVLALEFLKKNPNDLKAIEFLGDAYGYQKKWDEAIDSYEQLVEANDLNANYHYKYGGVLGMKALSVSKLRALGIIGDVKRAFLRAAELDPNHIDTRWALVELYMQLPGIIGGSKKKALKYANELQNLSEVDGYLAKGYIYNYSNNFEESEANYLKAVNVGGSVTCYQKLTDMYVKFNKEDKAIATLEEAYQVHQIDTFKSQIEELKAN